MLHRATLLLAAVALTATLTPRDAAAQDATAAAPTLEAAAATVEHIPVPLTAERAPAAAGEQAAPRIPMRRFAEAPVIAEEVAAPVMQARNRRGIPLMAAGLGLLVAGAIIGGDTGTIVMVSGAAIGAYGMYLYF